MKVAIVLGYGVFDENNQEYKDYLDWIAQDIKNSKIERAILCGGYTNNTKPELSEAQSIHDYLKILLPNFDFFLEDKSLTTPQNFENAAKQVNKGDEIIVYGDLIRMAKISWLAIHFFLGLDRKEIARIVFGFAKDKKLKPFVYENLTIKVFDFPSRDKYLATAQSFSTLLEVEGIYDTELDRLILDQRKKDFGIK